MTSRASLLSSPFPFGLADWKILKCRYLESLLNKSLKDCPLSLPELFPHVDPLSSSPSNEPSYVEHTGKKRWNLKSNEDSSQNRKKENRKNSNKSNSDNSGKYKQPTILDMLRKAGAVPSQEVPNEDLSCTSSKCSIPMMAVHNSSKSSEPENVEVSEVAKILDGQRYKFRPLSIECFSILAFSKVHACTTFRILVCIPFIISECMCTVMFLSVLVLNPGFKNSLKFPCINLIHMFLLCFRKRTILNCIYIYISFLMRLFLKCRI